MAMTDDLDNVPPIAELAALQGGPGDQIADDGFSAGVLRGIGKRRRRRAIMISSAGSIGAAIAGAQLTSFFDAAPLEQVAAQVGPYAALTPEALATVAIASLVAVVGFIIPGRV